MILIFAAAAERVWIRPWQDKNRKLFLFPICPQDKVILSVAILPMATEYGWSPTVAGFVQSSFFWGYMLSQLPSGYANSTFGGRRILPAGVLLWSGATGEHSGRSLHQKDTVGMVISKHTPSSGRTHALSTLLHRIRC